MGDTCELNQPYKQTESKMKVTGRISSDCGNAQTSNPVQTKKTTKETEMAYTESTSYQFHKRNCQMFINIKKYKIMFKIKYLRIIFFLKAL